MTKNRADEEISRLRAELAEAQAAFAREQRRVAEALHDGACQTLGGIALIARVLSRKLQAEHPERAREVTELGELVERAGGELRRVVRGLRPAKNERPGPAPE